LQGENLAYAGLSGANLTKSNLFGSDLSRATCQGADFSGANLGSANFAWTDIHWAKLSPRTYVQGANFHEATMTAKQYRMLRAGGAVGLHNAHIVP
jgi:uncharacterized protein YjbI with pentapeptide repeats